MADNININSPDAILLELIKGQERAAEALKSQNVRLFGGDGQTGALQFLVNQHDALVKKIDDTRLELAEKVESARTELAANVESTRKDLSDTVSKRESKVDSQISVLTDKHDELNGKVNRSIGWATGFGAAVSLVLGYLGIHRG